MGSARFRRLASLYGGFSRHSLVGFPGKSYSRSLHSPLAYSGYPSASTKDTDIAGLGIHSGISEALANKNIINLTPIQRAVFLPALEGRDLIARAKTGAGKTLAFGIPILEKITKEKQQSAKSQPGTPRALIITPTRELAKQVENDLMLAAPHLTLACIYGGISIEGQRRQLERPVDVVVGTPGRVVHMIDKTFLKLNEVKYLVLDESDQMLKSGFTDEVDKIMNELPSKRQNFLFSATLPTWVKGLSVKYLKDPLTVDLVGENEETMVEGINLYSVVASDITKKKVLADLLAVYGKGGKTIVFTKTIVETDEVVPALSASIGCEPLHGDMSQYQREKTLAGFREGKFSVLVATDLAARGLSVPDVDLVVHYDIPNDSETFVHRSGRIGRGKSGTCILMYNLQQRRLMKSIETDVGCKFEGIAPPSAEDVLSSSANQAVETLKNTSGDLIKIFLPAAEKLLKERGADALAAAIAHVSGVTKLPPKRSLLTHQEGYVTIQLIGTNLANAADATIAVRELSPRAADRMGKVFVIADPKIEGVIFDLPQDIAKELLAMEYTTTATISPLKVLPDLEEDFSLFGNSSFEGITGVTKKSDRPSVGTARNMPPPLSSPPPPPSPPSYGGAPYGGSGGGGAPYGSAPPPPPPPSYGGSGGAPYGSGSSGTPYGNRGRIPSVSGPVYSGNRFPSVTRLPSYEGGGSLGGGGSGIGGASSHSASPRPAGSPKATTGSESSKSSTSTLGGGWSIPGPPYPPGVSTQGAAAGIPIGGGIPYPPGYISSWQDNWDKTVTPTPTPKPTPTPTPTPTSAHSPWMASSHLPKSINNRTPPPPPPPSSSVPGPNKEEQSADVVASDI